MHAGGGREIEGRDQMRVDYESIFPQTPATNPEWMNCTENVSHAEHEEHKINTLDLEKLPTFFPPPFSFSFFFC